MTYSVSLQGRIVYAPLGCPQKECMIRNLCTYGAYAIRPYPDGRKELYLRSIWDQSKWHDLLFDLENVHAESIIPLLESRKSYAKWHDPFFDQTETYAKCIDLLFESKNSYAKQHDPFFDLKNDHEKFHLFLFDLKNSHAKRYSRYFCRGVLHTPPQCILKRNV